MFQKGLISQTELDRSKNAFADAEVNYQQSLLAVLFEQQYVTVDRAMKYQAADGNKRVKLTVANASGGGEEFQKLVGIEDKLFSLAASPISFRMSMSHCTTTKVQSSRSRTSGRSRA